jgi:hypothetical protein
MAVMLANEVLPRTFSHKFGESPTAERKFVVTVDVPTPTASIISAIGIFHGDSHPEFAYLLMLDASITETDRHHVEVTCRYEVPKQEDLDPNPLARPDVWSFSTGGAQVPALTYYHGTGNADRRPLVNAAGDFFEGLQAVESEVRATIAGNRAAFPLADAAAVTNTINASPYLGGSAHTWLCAGISGSAQTEVVNDEELRFWSITVELVYRRSGHNLLLPHVGWHYVNSPGGPKFRTFVRADDGTDVAAGTPQPLTETGSQKYVGGTSGPPDILERRIYPAVNFSSYFGTPPF